MDVFECMRECMLAYPTCDMIVMEGADCHMGDSNQTASAFTPNTGGPWDIYASDSEFYD